MFFTALWMTVVVLLLGGLIRWAGPRNTKLGAIAIAAAALIWTIFCATMLQDVNWPLPRPIAGGWIVLVVILSAGVVALVVFRFSKLGELLAWVTLALAVFLSCVEFLSPSVWQNWANGPIEGKAIILALAIISTVFLFWFGRLVGWLVLAVAALMVVTWGVVSLGGAISGTSPTATPSATASTSATPSPSPTTTSDPVEELKATEGSLIGWDNVISVVDEQNATWWPTLINDNSSKLGFDWDDAKAWSTKTKNDKVLGTRLVVVFGANSSDISDKAARKLGGVAGNTDVLVVRAGSCYQPVSGTEEVCPSGNSRVVLFIAPVGANDEKIFLKTGSGIALIPSSDGKTVLTPATYVAKS